MPIYLFQLGHVPDLSLAELASVFKTKKITADCAPSRRNWCRVETTHPLLVADLMHTLGGTIKIVELVNPTANNRVANIINYLQSLQITGKLNFSLSGTEADRLAIKIKKQLTAASRLARYIKPKNTATILHNWLVESGTDLTLVDGELFVTRAIQPLEEFSARDYGRPGFDPKSGMLPPKLARIMINLSDAEPNSILLDPFCGSGTILIEALSLGFKKIIGSDQSSKAIADSQKNVDWFGQHTSLTNHASLTNNTSLDSHALLANHTSLSRRTSLASRVYRATEKTVRLLQTDARELRRHLPEHSVDVVVTEPYLGRPLRGREPRSFIESQAHELNILYAATFRSLAYVMKPKSTVIFITPEFHLFPKNILVDCLPSAKNAGFRVAPLSPQHESILYRRPNQLVGRRIWRFKKQL